MCVCVGGQCVHRGACVGDGDVRVDWGVPGLGEGTVQEWGCCWGCVGLGNTCQSPATALGKEGGVKGGLRTRERSPRRLQWRGERRMNGPDQDEEPFLSYRSYEGEQRSREEAQHGGRETPNGGGGRKRGGKWENDRAQWRLIQEGEARSAQ